MDSDYNMSSSFQYKGTEKWSKHLDGYVSVDSPTPTIRRRSLSMNELHKLLPPKDNPDEYPLYYIWDNLQTPCLLVSIGLASAVIGYGVISLLEMGLLLTTVKLSISFEILWL